MDNINLDNNHNNLYLILITFGFNILSHFTPSNVSLVAGIIAIIGGMMAIINYIILWYDRYKTKK